jgi:hypothetical protein
MNNSNSEDLGYDLVSDFDIKAIDTKTHDADPDQDPSTSSTKITDGFRAQGYRRGGKKTYSHRRKQ